MADVRGPGTVTPWIEPGGSATTMSRSATRAPSQLGRGSTAIGQYGRCF